MQVLESVICPRIYRLLSDMLPAPTSDDVVAPSEDKIAFVAKLTKCFSDCAAILVIDHRRLVSLVRLIMGMSKALMYVTGLVDFCRTLWQDVLVTPGR